VLAQPDYAAGEYVVQFALMNDASHHVKCHTDDDVSFQYALTLGDFSGATLRVYKTRDKSAYIDFRDAKNQIVKFDGRLPHEVLTDGFRGHRFTVIWYKNFDHRKRTDDPILQAPAIVDTSAL
jgi:hypothetical protein